MKCTVQFSLLYFKVVYMVFLFGLDCIVLYCVSNVSEVISFPPGLSRIKLYLIPFTQSSVLLTPADVPTPGGWVGQGPTSCPWPPANGSQRGRNMSDEE